MVIFMGPPPRGDVFGLNPGAGILNPKYKTAFIFTSDMSCYAVVIKHPERGFFHAVINKKPYVFWLSKRSTYSLNLPKAPKYPALAFYNIADATPVNFDDLLRFNYFVKLNPGAKITPEIADIIIRNQTATKSTESVEVQTGPGMAVLQGADGMPAPAVGNGHGPGGVPIPAGGPGGAVRAAVPGPDVPDMDQPGGQPGPQPGPQVPPPPPPRSGRQMYVPENELDFKTPDSKKFAALSKKIRSDIAKVKSECVVVDLEKYINTGKHPDDHSNLSAAIIQEFGRRDLLIPPVDFTEALGARMSDSSGMLGFIHELKRATKVEYDKLANPTQTANRFWIMLFGIIGGIAACGVAAWLLMGGFPEPIDFSQYVVDNNPFSDITDAVGGAVGPLTDQIGDAAGRAQDTVQDLTAPAPPVIVEGDP